MKRFDKELEVGEIHSRDRWQFELKSEFIPLPGIEENHYKEEFYFFIPAALQINRESYPKEQFYLDQTNLIRYKTPQFTIKQLLNPENPLSPINRILTLTHTATTKMNRNTLEYEMKLLANIIRSSIRDRIGELIEEIHSDEPDVSIHIDHLCEDVLRLRDTLKEIQNDLVENWTGDIREHYDYIDEFISNTISYSFTALMEELLHNETNHVKERVMEVICREKQYRVRHLHAPEKIPEDEEQQEFIFYRAGLLKKFILDALRLSTSRMAVHQEYQHIVGAVAAGIAMLIFLTLFVWGGTIFVINSLPFILITVIFYILKDRIKEGLKTISYERMFKWFYDYKTEIRSVEEEKVLGYLKESFAHIKEDKLPSQITDIRNREFHAVLEKIERPEQVIHYKKQLFLKLSFKEDARRRSLNMISRFNIAQFIKKADEPLHAYTDWDCNKEKLIHEKLPKVYHINIIMRNTFLNQKREEVVELKKYRIIVDKNGIKRVEQLPSH